MEAVKRLTAGISQKIAGLVLRAVVRIVNDSGGVQILQIQGLEGEERDEVERIQNFGFTSNPPAGSEAVVLAVNGDRGHLLAVAVEHRASRKTGLNPGESAVFGIGGYGLVVRLNGDVMLGSDTALDPVARKSDLDSIVAYITSHTHPVSGALAGPSSVPPTAPTCSTKVFSA